MNLVATTDIHKAIKISGPLKQKHSQVIKKCNSLWKLLQSPKANESLKSYLGIAIKKSVVTRWNSLYDCFKQLLKVEEGLLADSNNIFKKSFSHTDFEFLQEYVECTTDLAKMIDRMQGDDCHYGILFSNLVFLRLKMVKITGTVILKWCKPVMEAFIKGC